MSINTPEYRTTAPRLRKATTQEITTLAEMVLQTRDFPDFAVEPEHRTADGDNFVARYEFQFPTMERATSVAIGVRGSTTPLAHGRMPKAISFGIRTTDYYPDETDICSDIAVVVRNAYRFTENSFRRAAKFHFFNSSQLIYAAQGSYRLDKMPEGLSGAQYLRAETGRLDIGQYARLMELATRFEPILAIPGRPSETALQP